MCTEFLLAIIYFLTIGVINFFLIKVITQSKNEIVSFLKVRNTLKYFERKEESILFFQCFCFKSLLEEEIQKNFGVKKMLEEFLSFQRLEFPEIEKYFLKEKDPLILGHLSHQLFLNSLESKKKGQIIYFRLLENQFLKEKKQNLF